MSDHHNRQDYDSLDSVEQAAMHGLLSGMYDGADESRVRLVMNEIRSENAANVIPFRRWIGRVAAVLLLGLGIVIGFAMHDQMPTAEATMAMATAQLEQATDREYRVRFGTDSGADFQFSVEGTIYTRSDDVWAVEFNMLNQSGWVGSDGTEGWMVMGEGLSMTWPADQQQGMMRMDEIKFANIHEFFDRYEERFDLTVVEIQDGLVHVRAVPKLGCIGEKVARVDIWINQESGLVHKIEGVIDASGGKDAEVENSRFRRPPMRFSLDYVASTSKPDSFYRLEGHQD
jgi:hypothetical protein